MTAAERRNQIAAVLAQSETPISASTLAAQLSVSRQLIVGDIALLRAGGMKIIATPRGYLQESQNPTQNGLVFTIACMHSMEQIAEEMNTIVDFGGALLDVTVEHSLYGEISAPLQIHSRYDTELFLEKMQKNGAKPLSDLTNGVHLHQICCESEDILHRIQAALEQRGILYHSKV